MGDEMLSFPEKARRDGRTSQRRRWSESTMDGQREGREGRNWLTDGDFTRVWQFLARGLPLEASQS